VLTPPPAHHASSPVASFVISAGCGVWADLGIPCCTAQPDVALRPQGPCLQSQCLMIFWWLSTET